MKRYVIQLTDAQADAARSIGQGNLALGVRHSIVFSISVTADIRIPLTEPKVRKARRKLPIDIM